MKDDTVLVYSPPGKAKVRNNETVTELRDTPAPEAFRAVFDVGYSLVEQPAEALRGTGTGTADIIQQLEGAGLGLAECTFALPS